MEFNLTLFFQLFNTAVWIGIIYFIFNLAIKLPKRIKKNEEKIERTEKLVREINKKLEELEKKLE